jgi:hypothetical protein
MKSPIQKRTFEGLNGFVLHKVPHQTLAHCRYSAWYAEDGLLLGAERLNRQDHSREVRKGGAEWAYLMKVGAQYKPKR